MSDLRERLSVLFGRQPSDGLVQFIETELAQATADALEAAAQVAHAHDEGPHDCKNWVREELCGQVIANEIRALAPDIAAKAKEHDATIRREAYLRCARHFDGISGWGLQQEAINWIRAQAEEADRGGK